MRSLRAVAPLMVVMMLLGGSAHAELQDTQRYEVAIGAPVVGAWRLTYGYGGVVFAASGTRALTITVDDDVSEVVPYLFVCQDSDGDALCESNEPELVGACTNTLNFADIPASEPKFNPNGTIWAFIYTVIGEAESDFDPSACPTAVGTAGSVTITYEDPDA